MQKRLTDARKEIIFVLVMNSSRTDLTPVDWRGIIEANTSERASAFCGLDKIAGVFVKTVFIFDIGDLGKKLLPRLTDI